MNPALELRDLRCRRGERLLFSGVSARVDGGKMLRVQGENGAGKTSLLRMICGLGAPDRGAVLWQGQPIAADREAFNRQLVYLGHAPALKDELSALENLQAACGLHGTPCTEADAAGALAMAGLRGRERLPARVLSQGQRKRAGLARLALAGTAALWVLDEPFSALDDAACAWLQGLIAAQLARGGVVVMTSHERRAWDGTPPQVSLVLRSPSFDLPAKPVTSLLPPVEEGRDGGSLPAALVAHGPHASPAPEGEGTHSPRSAGWAR